MFISDKWIPAGDISAGRVSKYIAVELARMRLAEPAYAKIMFYI